MKPLFRHTVTALVLSLLLFSCSGRQRIIPRDVLTDIYVDMFLADQWLEDHRSEKSRTDTLLFYDPIFQRYGYTFEDYDRSVQHYLKDPERFSKIFRDAAQKLRDKEDQYEKKAERIKQIREYNEAFRGFKSVDFDRDTFLWAAPITDSLVLDSLRRDSLRRDSILREAFRLDSLRRDSLLRDSVRRINEKHDSIMNRLRPKSNNSIR